MLPEPFRPAVIVRDAIERRLRRWRGLARVPPDRLGAGSTYRVGGVEIAHFHGTDRLDVRLTRVVIARRRARGTLDARLSVRGPFSEWVAVPLDRAGSLSLALGLLRAAMAAHGAGRRRPRGVRGRNPARGPRPRPSR